MVVACEMEAPMVLYIVSVVGWLDVHVNTHCGFSIMGELPRWVCELKFCTGALVVGVVGPEGDSSELGRVAEDLCVQHLHLEPCPERWGGAQGVRPDLGGDQPGLLGG